MDMSLEDQYSQISTAFGDMAMETEMPSTQEMPDLCLCETYPTYVIVCLDGKYYQVNFTNTDGEIEFDTPDKWVEVVENEGWTAKAKLAKKITVKAKLFTIKAFQDGDEWKLEVLGVPFGGPRNGRDIEGEYFDKATKTYQDLYPEIPVTYFHALDEKTGQPTGDPSYIGKAKYDHTDERGHWYTAILDKTKEYASRVWEAAKKGYAAASSETLEHLRRVAEDGHIENWPVAGMALLDVTGRKAPVNSYAIATPAMKAMYDQAGLKLNVTAQADKQSETTPPQDKAEAVKAQSAGGDSLADTSKLNTENNKMEFTEEQLKDLLASAVEQGADKAVKAMTAALPATNDGGHITVTLDEADRPFKTLAENARAVKAYELSKGQEVAPRLKYLKAAAGASEGSPSDGGILLDPTLTAEVIKPLHEEGVFSKDIRMLPVSGNSNYGWINGVDETSRATGSRWGGIRGYRLAEAASINSSKPTFRRIDWELKKYGIVVYGTDELLADVSLFSAVVNQGAREELSFMYNDDIMNGTGVAGAQGFMNSGALITVTRDTAAAIKGTDISAMWQRMSPRSKANAKWYVNSECAPQLDALFAVGSTAVLFPYAGYTIDGVRTLYGRPVVETEFNAALNTTGDIALCDMSQYLGWEKAGVEAATSIHLQFLTDETTFRFIYRSDGKSSLAAPLTPYKGTLTHSPFVVLGSASA